MVSVVSGDICFACALYKLSLNISISEISIVTSTFCNYVAFNHTHCDSVFVVVILPTLFSTGSAVTYTNWAVGQPGGAAEDCVIMNVGQNGEWYDFPCNNTFPAVHDREFFFVCEYGE
jgi:hypothetical protein